MSDEEKDRLKKEARDRSVWDQAAAAMRDMAPVLAVFFKALLAEGFSPAQALDLTRAMMVKGIFNRGSGETDDK